MLIIVLQVGVVEVWYSAAGKVAKYWVILQAGAVMVKLDILQAEVIVVCLGSSTV